MSTKLKPCDCKDIVTASKLNEQGIGHNDQSIKIKPNLVILTICQGLKCLRNGI